MRRGGVLIDTPDELYGKYIEIVTGLPIDTEKWSITLCSSSMPILPSTFRIK